VVGDDDGEGNAQPFAHCRVQQIKHGCAPRLRHEDCSRSARTAGVVGVRVDVVR